MSLGKDAIIPKIQRDMNAYNFINSNSFSKLTSTHLRSLVLRAWL